MKEKQTIREKILDMRRSLTSKYIEEASGRIVETVMGLPCVKQAQKVLIYSNFDNEVKTAELTALLLYAGKTVYLPAVDAEEMHAVNIRNAVLELHRFGVAQPRLEHAEIADPMEIDLVIVPGVAFDRQKNRLGFGKGYYDRYLKQAKNAYKLALAYDFQVVKSVPANEQDVRMDQIVTPDAVIG